MASAATISNTNFGILIAVWLDAEVNINEENRKAQKQLLTIINRLKTFENRNECEKYIRSVSSQEQLLLIVSGRLGKELVPHIHDLRQVTSIYVYCNDKKCNEQWANHFTKVKAVINRLDELIYRIRIDQENLILVDRMQILSSPVVINGISQLTMTPALTMAYSYLLTIVLLRMKPYEADKNSLISSCKDYYKDSKAELNNIREFQEEYVSDKALWWYSCESFIYKLLNKALRTDDIDMIFLFQFFIRDMHQQLTKNLYQYPVRVYRGQRIEHNEINNLKRSVRRLTSTNGFFSTTIERVNALNFLSTQKNSKDTHPVLFEIDADPKVVATKPFADISKYSCFPEEREILFTIGCIFRIIDVKQDDDQKWIVQLRLCGDDDPDLKAILDELMQEYKCSDDKAILFSFSRVLRAMNKLDEAEKYCHRLLREFSSNDSLLAIVYDELAKITSSKNDYDLSIQWQQKSIKIKNKIESASVGNTIGASNSNSGYKSSDIRDMNNSMSVSTASNSVTFDHHQFENNLRFTDVAAEKHDVLLPIEGHEKMPLVTLEEAVVPLISILPDIRRKVHTAKLKCKNPADGLTSDQSAAIILYTMEWEPKDECLYFALNARLRAANRKILKPWFLYLKLILTGLSHLPSIQRTVYRGVKLDLSSEHHEGDLFFWWGFSSCTTTMNVLKSDQFLGNSGIRTFFLIECINGKDIRNHSYYQKEDEILLLPATYLKVISCFEMASDLHAIQLKEIKPEFPYLEPVI